MWFYPWILYVNLSIKYIDAVAIANGCGGTRWATRNYGVTKETIHNWKKKNIEPIKNPEWLENAQNRYASGYSINKITTILLEG